MVALVIVKVAEMLILVGARSLALKPIVYTLDKVALICNQGCLFFTAE